MSAAPNPRTLTGRFGALTSQPPGSGGLSSGFPFARRVRPFARRLLVSLRPAFSRSSLRPLPGAASRRFPSGVPFHLSRLHGSAAVGAIPSAFSPGRHGPRSPALPRPAAGLDGMPRHSRPLRAEVSAAHRRVRTEPAQFGGCRCVARCGRCPGSHLGDRSRCRLRRTLGASPQPYRKPAMSSLQLGSPHGSHAKPSRFVTGGSDEL